MDKINSIFAELEEDISEYLKDDTVPMENYAEDIFWKIERSRKKIIDSLA